MLAMVVVRVRGEAGQRAGPHSAAGSIRTVQRSARNMIAYSCSREEVYAQHDSL